MVQMHMQNSISRHCLEFDRRCTLSMLRSFKAEAAKKQDAQGRFI